MINIDFEINIGFKMKGFILAIVLLLAQVSDASPFETSSGKSYDVAQVYKSVELERGSKVIDSYGNIKEGKTVLVPTKIDEGKYSVELTKIDSNFYKIYGTDLYVETKYCYEYASREEVILVIRSNYGYTKGEVIFID